MKKTAGLTGAVAVLLLCVTLVHCGPSKEEIAQEMIRQMADKLNKGGVQKIDDNSELMSAEALPGVLVLNIRLLMRGSSLIKGDSPFDLNLAELKRYTSRGKDFDPTTGPQLESMRPVLVKAACDSNAARNLLRHQITLRYTLHGGEGMRIGSLDVNPGNCGLQTPGT